MTNIDRAIRIIQSDGPISTAALAMKLSMRTGHLGPMLVRLEKRGVLKSERRNRRTGGVDLLWSYVGPGKEVVVVRNIPPPKAHQQFVIGTGGKRIKLPRGQQAKFTSVNNVKPEPVGLARGWDVRYQMPPDFRGGEFSKLGIGHYVEE